MLNKVILIGYLGADPESKTMNSGAEIVNFRLATSESYTDKNTNQKIGKTEWHSVVVFNPHLAKIALQYLHKGSKVYVEGKLQTRKWQDKNVLTVTQQKLSYHNIKGNCIYLMQRKSNQQHPHP
ncbi:single-stranded DNA-binding protein [Bartonella krasnovii]|uniref:single-stranded DNA-binding protein n=1 Tax=Bartonella krasnovii TaxID=2267275 RepID=UPI001F4C97D3|nr:single-stranded DNA-binding protein [Bartonella krasnovii]UNF39120.1 single-stranded DNA-binding protein [Bartonella krasnovii]UNF44138.1 single-stranded DNA-binding protein [Bartonella krasnovii]UNF47317.1 single-stranded DNA-binding protein [Bartonella krasnovii]UNF50661.1 single-stranded DNA-binding protein [Bartonella krasnovii]